MDYKIKQTILHDREGNPVGDIILEGDTLYIRYLDQKGIKKTFYIKQ